MKETSLNFYLRWSIIYLVLIILFSIVCYVCCNVYIDKTFKKIQINSQEQNKRLNYLIDEARFSHQRDGTDIIEFLEKNSDWFTSDDRGQTIIITFGFNENKAKLYPKSIKRIILSSPEHKILSEESVLDVENCYKHVLEVYIKCEMYPLLLIISMFFIPLAAILSIYCSKLL